MAQRKDRVRIANASGYWGDDPEALARQLEAIQDDASRLDYITMDFLAEVTMSIMQKQRQKDPSLGYARDFIDFLDKNLPLILEKDVCLIVNAGGVNPNSCAQRTLELGREKGMDLRVAVVEGDAITDQVADYASHLSNMETQEDFKTIQDRVLSANVYFGAEPVVWALEKAPQKPHIIITGRVTDTGISMAPIIYELGWSLDDYDKLAQALVAGHLLECGAQACGGNFTDWKTVPHFQKMGYPIVEMEAGGTFSITRHPGLGGIVSEGTVKEQLFYEMGDPKAYLSPDVIADFSSLRIRQDGANKVVVEGATGKAPSNLYKVSMGYQDGYKVSGELLVAGKETYQKAKLFADLLFERVGLPTDDLKAEMVGLNATIPKDYLAFDKPNHTETLLKLSARADNKEVLARFAKLVPGMLLSGPPGVCVTGSGVGRPKDVISFWPALIPRDLVHPKVGYVDQKGEQDLRFEERPFEPTPTASIHAADKEKSTNAFQGAYQKVKGDTELFEIAFARSGDKGDSANIGVLARNAEAYAFLDQTLTCDVVKDIFKEFCQGEVYRYSLPSLEGFNFILEQSLDGGGARSLRMDAQGKIFAQALLMHPFKIPPDLIHKS